jgi:hypothetical protein
MEHENEIVTRCAPRWAWEVIDETLSLDSISSAFDPVLRRKILEAFEAMIDACEAGS